MNKKKKHLSKAILAASLETVVDCRSPPSLRLFYRCYFRRKSLELAELTSFCYPCQSSACDSDRLICHHSWMVAMRISTVFFSFTTRFWNILPAECFSLTYDLHCLKSLMFWALFNWLFYMLFFFVHIL